jgi:hypothetical protein
MPTHNNFQKNTEVTTATSPELGCFYENIEGLENTVSRYNLLILVKRLGKHAGFSPRMIALLDYYIAFTRECDWEEGASPVIYQSLAKTSLDMGVSERQIQRLENQLHEVGALSWRDSGNHKRYGQRDKRTGQILYAFGVDLSPLAAKKEQLEKLYAQKQAHDQSWMETKRQISWHRRQIRSGLDQIRDAGQGGNLLDTLEDHYRTIAKPIRTHMDLQYLQNLKQDHKTLWAKVSQIVCKMTAKESCSDDKNVAQIHSSTHKQSNKLDSRARLKSEISVTNPRRQEPNRLHVKQCAPDNRLPSIKKAIRMINRIDPSLTPTRNKPLTWQDIVEVAYVVKNRMNVSQSAWGEACQVLGRYQAALDILAVHFENPDNAAKYFKLKIKQGREHGPMPHLEKYAAAVKD